MRKGAFLGVAIIALLIVAAGAVWPLLRAQNEYAVATKNYDSGAKCRAAGRVAEAWAGLGFTERNREWVETQKYNCRYAYPDRI